MRNHHPQQTITALQRRWQLQAIAGNLLLSFAISLLVFLFLYAGWRLQAWWLLSIVLMVSCCTFYVDRHWRISATDVAVYLDKNIAALQESTALLLRRQQSLNLLEQLQRQQTAQQLSSSTIPNPLKKHSAIAAGSLLFAILIAVIVIRLAPFNRQSILPENVDFSLTKKETRPPQIESAVITITPPAYTGRSARKQSRFNLQAEENSRVSWLLETTMPVKHVQLIYNDKTVVPLSPEQSSNTRWSAQRLVTRSGFYQLKINDQLSDLYQVEIIKDKPPVITVQSPKSGTLIENGRPWQVPLDVVLTDDYGVADATILATVASGSGEAVKFSEQQIGLNNFKRSAEQRIRQVLNLRSLNMAPGDELYFYIKAADNHGQQARSDVFMVTIQDTAGLMSVDGLTMGVGVKPEFFRSQRQIIIETEQLLKSKDTMTVKDFNNKSNDLGVDQKLLRLRYGKFLGEESNTEIGDGHEDHAGEHVEAPGFGKAEDIMDQFAHKHDIAEDATFFDPETKKQLKATLAEMWKAEGKLRTLKPAEALPFEYKALRLLKDLQQKSRVYVAKTGLKTTPLQPVEKRLTGELDKIQQPSAERKQQRADMQADALRIALSVLEQMKKGKPTAAQLAALQNVADPLANKAAANPKQYVGALQAYKKITSAKGGIHDIITLQKGLQNILQAPQKLPYQPTGSVPGSLGKMYFNNMKSGGR